MGTDRWKTHVDDSKTNEAGTGLALRQAVGELSASKRGIPRQFGGVDLGFSCITNGSGNFNWWHQLHFNPEFKKLMKSRNT